MGRECLDINDVAVPAMLRACYHIPLLGGENGKQLGTANVHL